MNVVSQNGVYSPFQKATTTTLLTTRRQSIMTRNTVFVCCGICCSCLNKSVMSFNDDDKDKNVSRGKQPREEEETCKEWNNSFASTTINNIRSLRYWLSLFFVVPGNLLYNSTSCTSLPEDRAHYTGFVSFFHSFSLARLLCLKTQSFFIL